MLDSERSKLGYEVDELQNWVARDEEKEEESRKEDFGLKQRVCRTNLLTACKHVNCEKMIAFCKPRLRIS